MWCWNIYNQVLFPDGSRSLETIDDLLKFVDENIAHNTAFTLEQRAAKMKNAGQLDMFADAGRVDDLPLFSGTPQQVAESAFTPPVNTGQQGKLFDTRPEFGGMENAAKPIAEMPSPVNFAEKYKNVQPIQWKRGHLPSEVEAVEYNGK